MTAEALAPSGLWSRVAERFWVFAYAALGLGLLLPIPEAPARLAIPLLLGSMLFFTCLKVSPSAVVREFERPQAAARLGGLVLLKLFLIPLAVFFASMWLGADQALGLLLVSAMPAGMSSVAFADVHRGNVPLALLVLLATSLTSPLSVPLMLELPSALGIAPGSPLGVADVAPRMLYIAALLGIPFALSQLVRRRARVWVDARQLYFTPLALWCLLVLIVLATSATRARWFEGGAVALVWTLVAVSVASVSFLGVGALLGRVLPRGDAIAFTCNAVYVNNGLAVAYALAFYPDRPGVVLPCILLTLPMVWVIGAARRVQRPDALGS